MNKLTLKKRLLTFSFLSIVLQMYKPQLIVITNIKLHWIIEHILK